MSFISVANPDKNGFGDFNVVQFFYWEKHNRFGFSFRFKFDNLNRVQLLDLKVFNWSVVEATATNFLILLFLETIKFFEWEKSRPSNQLNARKKGQI